MNTLTLGGWGTSSLIHQIRKRMGTTFWDWGIKIVLALIAFASLAVTIWGFVWNARERRKEITEARDFEISQAKDVSNSKNWTELKDGIVGMRMDIQKLADGALSNYKEQKVMNEHIISRIDDHGKLIGELKLDIKDVKTRVDNFESKFINLK